jgi:hypothetical protein
MKNNGRHQDANRRICEDQLAPPHRAPADDALEQEKNRVRQEHQAEPVLKVQDRGR